MKKAVRGILFIIVIALGLNSHAQKNDYVWLTGYDGYPHITYDTIDSVYFANTVLDFNYTPVRLSPDSLQMNFSFTNTMYSDDNGNLLFYTNGIYIANALDEMIANSDSLNFGWLIYSWDPSIQRLGYNSPQGILALTDVQNDNKYYLLQGYADSVGGTAFLAGTKVLSTFLDMNQNNGLGQVVYKNQPIVEGEVGTNLSATRHGNGRDWWILVEEAATNCYWRILLDETGPHSLPDLTCTGSTDVYGDVAASCFSPDGSKYIYLSSGTGLNIYDFDRCSGILSNPLVLPIPALVDSIWLGKGVAISPNKAVFTFALSPNFKTILFDNQLIISLADDRKTT